MKKYPSSPENQVIINEIHQKEKDDFIEDHASSTEFEGFYPYHTVML